MSNFHYFSEHELEGKANLLTEVKQPSTVEQTMEKLQKPEVSTTDIDKLRRDLTGKSKNTIKICVIIGLTQGFRLTWAV